MPSLLDGLETVALDAVQPHPENPHRGDVEAIGEMLRELEQYVPIVVQRSTNYIVKGNHTWMAAKAEGWEEIDVVFIDVDDTKARKIMLGDNHSSELGFNDNDALAILLTSLQEEDDLAGTLYSTSDVDILLATVNTHYEPSTAETLTPPQVRETTIPSGVGTPVPSVPRSLVLNVSDEEYEDAIAGLRRLQAAREADSLGKVVCDLVAEACENLDSAD